MLLVCTVPVLYTLLITHVQRNMQRVLANEYLLFFSKLSELRCSIFVENCLHFHQLLHRRELTHPLLSFSRSCLSACLENNATNYKTTAHRAKKCSLSIIPTNAKKRPYRSARVEAFFTPSLHFSPTTVTEAPLGAAAPESAGAYPPSPSSQRFWGHSMFSLITTGFLS